jgi:mRNA-degrading endonuclease RelE of RelBE toxin-antitoxin system
MNQVFETDTFSKFYDASDGTVQKWVEKVKDQLAESLAVGKPLHFEWFREKKFGTWRLFYLINEKQSKVLLVALGTKKDQQRIIDHILQNKERYLKQIS